MISTTLITSQEVNDITSNPCTVYVATSSGIDIIRKRDFSNIAYAGLGQNVSTVYHNPDKCEGLLYIGTSAGVKGLATVPTANGNQVLKVFNKFYYPFNLLSNEVYSIDGNGHGDVAVATDSGIDLHTWEADRFYCSVSGGVDILHLTEQGDVYYSPVISGGLSVKYGPVEDNWSSPDYTVTTTGSYPLPSDEVNDIEVSTVSGINHVFIATSNGLFIYEEDRNDIEASLSGAILYENYP